MPDAAKNETLWEKIKSGSAFCAVVIGVIGGLSGLYSGFLKTPADQRVTVALEVSQNYLRNVPNDLIVSLNAAMGGEELSEDAKYRIEIFADTGEYVAALVDANRLDISFLAPALQCALKITAGAVEKYKMPVPSGGRPLRLIELEKLLKCTNPWSLK